MNLDRLSYKIGHDIAKILKEEASKQEQNHLRDAAMVMKKEGPMGLVLYLRYHFKDNACLVEEPLVEMLEQFMTITSEPNDADARLNLFIALSDDPTKLALAKQALDQVFTYALYHQKVLEKEK